ncbi:MAG: N-acetylmuramoyl-L-alanine amidase [Polyangiaceae bacterium]
MLLVVGACGAPGAKETLATPGGDPSAAAALLSAPDLPDRFEVVAVADRLAVSAARASAPKDVSAAAIAAGELRERLFRTSHIEADGREAVVLYERALQGDPGSRRCDVALRRTALLAEIGSDPATAARETRSATVLDACAPRLAPIWATLGAFQGAPLSLPAVQGSSATAPASSAVYLAPQAQIEQAVASPPKLPASAAPVKVLAVEPFGEKESARIVIRLEGATAFKVGTAPPKEAGKGPRVYVDIDKARLGKHARELKVGGLVSKVRLGTHENGVRVVVDLEKKAIRRVFYLPEPFRVIIDLNARAAPASAAAAGSSSTPGVRPVGRVVLDPGHGGHDPGAIGPRGTKEKDVTLDIAHRAAPLIARELGISTLITRDTDDFVALEERAARANAFGADLFVSIHCNASESPTAHGIETYVLDTNSDAVSARVAARENAASSEAGAAVAGLVGELKLAYLGTQSTHFAELLQRTAIASLQEKYPGSSSLGVKTAGFYVLVGAQMPSALFETSFISNAVEEERLASEDYRQKLADAIVNAIRAYREGR